MIEVRDAKKWIQNGARRVEILKGITLTIPAGQFVAIVGASGSGKSTLLGLLAAWTRPAPARSGWTACRSTIWPRRSWPRCAGSKIGFVFQSYQLIADADGAGKCAAALSS